ncbi:MAG: STAS domain-containing protein [Verrucomicrobiota bacterium]|nr:STAS domain-containing protein [Chthoniobacterales bacterium]MDQ3626411.1 STAS domain-containing protein [Verrucomicrobiota bacterium]
MPKSAPPKVFSYEGAIDLHVSPEVRAALREITDQQPKRLVVDLSRVPYVDSSGLAVLIGAKQELEAAGGVFILAGAQDAVRTILESARLDQYFRLVRDLDAALAAT